MTGIKWTRAPLRTSRSAAILCLLLAGCADLIGLEDYEVGSGSGGVGGVGGVGGSGGSGGSGGGGLPCVTPDGCPSTENECRVPACIDGQCSTADVKAGTPVASQSNGDCKLNVCNGNGNIVSIEDPADVQDDSVECTKDTCVSSEPMHEPEAQGSPCGPSSADVCDGMGACVECNFGVDCDTKVCQGNTCVPPTCMDNVQNGSETGKDCGGGCGPCPDGSGCVTEIDCTSSVCLMGTCAAPLCTDGVKNGEETDIDCGATCPEQCGPNEGCIFNGDCTGGLCNGVTCSPTCSDFVLNNAETDVDCGGPSCLPCGDNKVCGVAADCQSGVCQSGSCSPPSCGDGITNGVEECDDGNADNTDACLSSCELAVCGDGIIRQGVEICDDGDGMGGDGCSATCAIEPGFACAGTPSVCAAGCGDGTKAGIEGCDDGDQTSGDGCDAACSIESGYVCVGSAPSVCSSVCGDGIKVGSEACDDGDTSGGDGCSAVCVVENGYSCSGAPSACAPICGDAIKLPGEMCDDGNAVDGDCCSSACEAEAGCEIEPNNTLVTANPFAAVSAGGNVKGFITPISDKDIFSFVIPPGVTGTAQFETLDGFSPGSTCAGLAVDSIVTIRNSGGSALIADDDSGSGFCSLVTAGNLAPGTYYAEVAASSGSPFSYVLNMALGICPNNMIEVGEQCDDGNASGGDGCSSACKLESVAETEPNNACVSADGPIAFAGVGSKLVSGAISPVGDIDWFSFSLPATADLALETFDIGGPGTCANTDTEIQLFQADCMTPMGPPQDFGGLGFCSKIEPIGHVQVRHLPAGNYLVKVNELGNNATLAGYTLQATVTALCGNGVVEGFEECDGGAMCAATCDRFQVCGDGFVDAPETCDDGNIMAGDGCDPACATEPGYTCGALAGGCVAVCGDTAVNAPETCDDGNTSTGDGCDSACTMESVLSEVEVNDTTAQADARAMDATPVLISAASTSVSGSIAQAGDKDLFKMVIGSSDVVRLETFEATGSTCLPGMATTLRLLDAGGAEIVADPTSSPANGPNGIQGCSALVLNVTPGIYYVQVEETGNDAAIVGYVLQAKLMTSKGVEGEPNENQNFADSMAGSDVVIEGSHTANTDDDFYMVTVPSVTSLRAEVIEGGAETCESGGMDSRLMLYDSTGTVLVDDDNDGRGLCSMIDGTGDFAAPDINAAGLNPGTYFLRVRASSNAQVGPAGQFDYRLAITMRIP